MPAKTVVGDGLVPSRCALRAHIENAPHSRGIRRGRPQGSPLRARKRRPPARRKPHLFNGLGICSMGVPTPGPGRGRAGNNGVGDGLVPSRCPGQPRIPARATARPRALTGAIGSPLRNCHAIQRVGDLFHASSHPGDRGADAQGTTVVGDGLVPSRCPGRHVWRGRPQGSPLRAESAIRQPVEK